MPRVVYPPEFDRDCAPLGGVSAVNRVLGPLEDSLLKNPGAFGLLEVDSGIYYGHLKAAQGLPELMISFWVDGDGDVVMGAVKARKRSPF